MVSTKVARLTPYVAGEQPQGGFIKLNTNENPYPPSKRVREVLSGIDIDKLKLYPDPDAKKLKTAIALYEGVGTENIFLGNGSDEVLAMAFYVLFEDSVIYSDITYSFYPVYADICNLKKVIVPLKKDFSLDIETIVKSKGSGIVIANPNAPTAISESEENILGLLQSVKDRNILLDEAYIDFSTKSRSFAKEASESDNLMVVKTFSKSYSLAGLRCGYAVANKELISALETVKNCFNSYTLDCICQECATASVNDREYFDECVSKVIVTRERTKKELIKMGATVTESDANFLFVSHKSLAGKEVYQKLKDNGVLVRHWQKDKIDNFVRVTIGTDKEMDEFLKQYKKL